jgi:hypothetical protein
MLHRLGRFGDQEGQAANDFQFYCALQRKLAGNSKEMALNDPPGALPQLARRRCATQVAQNHAQAETTQLDDLPLRNSLYPPQGTWRDAAPLGAVAKGASNQASTRRLVGTQ